MQREGIVNGVNQAGKAISLNDQEKAPVCQKKNGLVDGLYRALNIFAHIMSPIKSNNKRR